MQTGKNIETDNITFNFMIKFMIELQRSTLNTLRDHPKISIFSQVYKIYFLGGGVSENYIGFCTFITF